MSRAQGHASSIPGRIRCMWRVRGLAEPTPPPEVFTKALYSSAQECRPCRRHFKQSQPFRNSHSCICVPSTAHPFTGGTGSIMGGGSGRAQSLAGAAHGEGYHGLRAAGTGHMCGEWGISWLLGSLEVNRYFGLSSNWDASCWLLVGWSQKQ